MLRKPLLPALPQIVIRSLSLIVCLLVPAGVESGAHFQDIHGLLRGVDAVPVKESDIVQEVIHLTDIPVVGVFFVIGLRPVGEGDLVVDEIRCQCSVFKEQFQGPARFPAEIVQMELNKELGIAILFISHDLKVVYELCSRIIVMKDGKIVEQGTDEEVFSNPKDPYTKQLLSSAGYGI